MGIVRTTVDDKIIQGTSANNVNQEVVEPVEEIKADEPKTEEDKVSPESPYGVQPEGAKEEATKVESKDEYGNEVAETQSDAPKGRTYSEEEVNRIVRDRLKRTEEGKRQEVQEAQPHEGDENWEAQLKGFVKNTIQEMSHDEQRIQREHKERESLGRLESNIHQSMGKYRDFQSVVGKVPITDTMVKATKNFKDPGAFLYAASKMQAKELERISKLDDPLDQAAEIGKLEERMRKLKGASNSPRPMTEIKGDITNRENIRPSVDDLIRKDQLKKFQRRY